ncbi:hypothetical protein LZ318_04480 [Saccharopolyspora indica]|uniref:hypothetical protein n=1 Tax=Saccharopolyspora indica TaxID=1229659 RepID=UPI0022EAA8B7|nr:hypothetical protein [Saccharopolyspora indica]MDA3646473.1 hypothetical protein [Saccharopolyspora indica]
MPSQTNPVEPVEEVRAIFDRTISRGWRPETTKGATAAQIAEFVAEQGVTSIPIALHEVYSLVGQAPGLWVSGSMFGVVGTGRRLKAEAASLLEETELGASGALVLTGHGGYEYQFIPGSSTAEPNPSVWLVRESDDEDESDEPTVIETWPSITAWLQYQADEVLRWRETFAARPGAGDELVTRYFTV